MAGFSCDFGVDGIIPKSLQSEQVFVEMVEAGQKVIEDEVRKGARKHVYTGAMYNSIKSAKPKVMSNGDVVGKVRFIGSDGVTKSKNGQKFDRTNWIKAFRIEYGTSNQAPKPFVRPVVKAAENESIKAMESVLNKNLGGD